MTETGNFRFLFFWLLLSLFVSGIGAQDANRSVFDRYQGEGDIWMKYSDLENSLYHHVAGQAARHLRERSETVNELETAGDWQNYLAGKRKALFSGLDRMERTPLNARVTGRVDREFCRLEKVVFESQPGFFVTGCIMIPTRGEAPFPAVLVAIGHSQAAFRRDIYQQNTLNLVKKGFVVFTFDPAGQGERVQYPDPSSGRSLVGGSTSEHSYAGAQCLLAGYSVNEHFIWDGVRALDYLLSRPEVDESRIGVTGISGGGTLTAFLAAYDERVTAAAPECYITGYQRLFESIGPQDAEQNFYHGLKLGTDHADFLTLRAPKPAMIISTTQDFFSIQGARETFSEARSLYGILGRPENLSMVESDGTHGTKKTNRENMYRFFREYLDNPGNSSDEELDYFLESELKVTPTGQVSSSYNSRSIFDLNLERVRQIISARGSRDPAELQRNRSTILERIREISGHDSTRSIGAAVFTGKTEYEDFRIEKYFIESGDFDYPIPFVFIKPHTDEKRPAIFYIDPAGKEGLLARREEIAAYLEKGYSILAPDLLGAGELANTAYQGDSFIRDISFNIWIGANLVGSSIAGLQSSDLELLYRYIKTRKDIDQEEITAVARGEICSSYLHFAVLNPGIKKTILVNPLVSYEDIVTRRYYDPGQMWTAVPGAIEFYDIPLMEALLSPSELVVINPVYGDGSLAGKQKAEDLLELPRQAYIWQGAEGKLRVEVAAPEDVPGFIAASL